MGLVMLDLSLLYNMSTNEAEAPKSKNKQYRKDKPWDDPSIDHWKVEEIKPEEVQPFLEESSFSVLFPQYR
jgi:ribosomal RNA assembly protein